MNQFGDLTQDEFRTHYLGARRPFAMKKKRSLSAKLQPHRRVPDTVDWRQEGYVTPVKNQGYKRLLFNINPFKVIPPFCIAHPYRAYIYA